MAKVSIETRHKVVSLRQQGLSQAEIARQTGVSKRAVQALLQKHKKTGTVEDQKRSGRPRKLSKADEKLIKLTFLENRTMSSSAITSELAVTSGTLVDPSTVRRCLARSGLNGRRGSKKQVPLCETSEDKTLSSEQKHENWDVNKLKQEVEEEKEEKRELEEQGEHGELVEQGEHRELVEHGELEEQGEHRELVEQGEHRKLEEQGEHRELEEQGQQEKQCEQETQGEEKVWTGESGDEISYSNSECGDNRSDESL